MSAPSVTARPILAVAVPACASCEDVGRRIPPEEYFTDRRVGARSLQVARDFPRPDPAVRDRTGARRGPMTLLCCRSIRTVHSGEFNRSPVRPGSSEPGPCRAAGCPVRDTSQRRLRPPWRRLPASTARSALPRPPTVSCPDATTGQARDERTPSCSLSTRGRTRH